jgi:glyoxylase-like metal-dependent hydrolase (beta-lactamase superfamily II)
MIQVRRTSTMDCCGEEGAWKGDAKFEIKKVADGVMVVDTHSKPTAARVIVEHLRGMTTKPVRYVVNTHFHWDHWHGNEVYPAAYPNAEIVTNQITREAMVTKGLKRIGDHRRQMPADIAKLEADVAAATGEPRARLERDLKLAQAYLAEVNALRPALPTIAFEETMKLYRRDREIHLLHLGRAHTAGDVFVYLPREKGHGDVADRGWLRVFRGYVGDMVTAVREEAARGATLDEVKQRVTAKLAPTYEKPFSAYGDSRPWRAGLAANVERTFAMVS